MGCRKSTAFAVFTVVLLMSAVDIHGTPRETGKYRLMQDLSGGTSDQVNEHRVAIEERALFGADTIIGFIIGLLAEILLSSNSEVTCAVLSQKEAVEFALDIVPDGIITSAVKRTIRKHAQKCENHTLGNAMSSHFVLLVKMAKNAGTYPGTKWCGFKRPGVKENELGQAEATDTCCRDNALLQNTIPILGALADVKNKFPYPIKSCDDDKKFYQCLLNDKSKASKEYGQFYFDVIKTRCYAKTYPMKCIEKKINIKKMKKVCDEYELDAKKLREYQLFKPASFYWEYVTKWNIRPQTERPKTGVHPPKSWKLIEIFDNNKPPEGDEMQKHLKARKPTAE